jgi:hypothetical protein
MLIEQCDVSGGSPRDSRSKLLDGFRSQLMVELVLVT